MAHRVTVTAVQDRIDEGAREKWKIRNVYSGADYGTFPQGEIEVTVTDDDMRGVIGEPRDSAPWRSSRCQSSLPGQAAGDNEREYTVVLNSQPTADVTIDDYQDRRDITFR